MKTSSGESDNSTNVYKTVFNYLTKLSSWSCKHITIFTLLGSDIKMLILLIVFVMWLRFALLLPLNYLRGVKLPRLKLRIMLET